MTDESSLCGVALDRFVYARYNIGMITDIHTHTTFSPDGEDDIRAMISAAKKAGVKYYGIAEHFDYSLNFCTSANDYFPCAFSLKKSEKDINLLIGAELGYSKDEKAAEYYGALIKEYNPDFIVNSVHSTDEGDYYYLKPYSGKGKKEAYEEYFSLVLSSLSAPYRYDIVGHIGYCSRYAPYEERKIIYSDFSVLIDKILRGIIERDKILEVNSSAAGSGGDFLPDTDILERYFKLGGRNISFSSDAHRVKDICRNRDKAVAALKKIGFEYITVPLGAGERIKVSILESEK